MCSLKEPCKARTPTAAILVQTRRLPFIFLEIQRERLVKFGNTCFPFYGAKEWTGPAPPPLVFCFFISLFFFFSVVTISFIAQFCSLRAHTMLQAQTARVFQFCHFQARQNKYQTNANIIQYSGNHCSSIPKSL